jgi:hypothetical protein
VIVDNTIISCAECIALGWRVVYGTCEGVTCPDHRDKKENEVDKED